MNASHFPEANCRFGPPQDLQESQCGTISGFLGKANGGSCDGIDIAVVAWQPNAIERAAIFEGAPIFLTMIGGLSPHMMTTTFREAIHPA